MNQVRLFPEKCRVLSGSMLKLIAVITMLIDHIASHLLPSKLVLFSFAGVDFVPYTVMRFIGRFAFPIFVFLMIEGFLHTRNRTRYGISLLICALLSEIPWNLVHDGELFCKSQNVFFTLWLGYFAICGWNRFRGKPPAQFIVLIAGGIIAYGLNADYNLRGYAFILVLFALRENELFRPFSSFLLTSNWGAFVGFIPISLYNGKRGFIRGPVLKYAFYAFYPVHLFVLYLIKYRILF